MSADLFAEFEQFSKPAQSAQPAQQLQESNKPSAGQLLQSTTSPTSFNPSQFSFGAGAPSSQPNVSHNNQWLSYQQPSSTVGWASSSSLGAPQTSQQPKADEEDDDDAWGDFEVASPEAQPTVPAFPQLNAFEARPSVPASVRNQPPQRTRITRASTLDLLSNNLIDTPEPFTLGENSSKPSWTAESRRQVPNRTPNPGPTHQRAATAGAELLFDADDFGGGQADDDDFGEFETVQEPPSFASQARPAQSAAKAPSTSDLLSGLNLTEPTSPYPQAPKSPSFYDRNPFPGLAVTTPPQKIRDEPRGKTKETPITAWPSFNDKSPGSNDILDEDWGAFADLPTQKVELPTKPVTDRAMNPAVRSFAKPTIKPAKKPAESEWDWDPVEPSKTNPRKAAPTNKTPTQSTDIDSSWDWDPVDTKTGTEVEASATKDVLPPANVPPPSVLLSIFPELFETANQKLYQPVSGQSFSIKKRILSDPKTVEFLRGYLSLATVLARIVAGRRLRWHRDKFLSQKMSISAAGSKGMKLATVDKAQTAREDREAADVVATWNEQVGRLRSAVAAANTSLQDGGAAPLKIPEIKEAMQVQTAKAVPTAPKACLICGLKRDERLAKVDHDVEDSFGEWWVDHWGHTACRRLWLQHEEVLRQR